MQSKLIKLANYLDRIGLTKEADYLDNILKNADWADYAKALPAAQCIKGIFSLMACGSQGKRLNDTGFEEAPNLPIDWDIEGNQKVIYTSSDYATVTTCEYNKCLDNQYDAIKQDCLDWGDYYLENAGKSCMQIMGEWLLDNASGHYKIEWDLAKMYQDGIINSYSEYTNSKGERKPIEDILSQGKYSLYFVVYAPRGSAPTGYEYDQNHFIFNDDLVYEEDEYVRANGRYGGYYYYLYGGDPLKISLECAISGDYSTCPSNVQTNQEDERLEGLE